jgi:hypothetical protein
MCALSRSGLIATALWLAAGLAGARADDPAGAEFFEKRVRPVLAAHCYGCHSAQAKKLKGGLRLDSRAGVLRGGVSGPAVVPGDADHSPLVLAVRYTEVERQMPPRAKLPDSAIADLTAWVKSGAPWPGGGDARADAENAFDIERRRREHWAWRPVRPGPPPAVRDTGWPDGPVDCFILAALEAKGLTPAPPADRRTLLRRLSFDLVGLPPSADEVEAFARDDAAGAYERAVERLLASPHFGERWGRHWLDLVRYAETRGHEFDFPAPNAYQYRDYVVRAFNADVPYAQFALEHVAGDLLDEPRLHPTAGFNESVLGTGFWHLGEAVHSPVDIRQDEADRFDNMIDVMTKTFLGLTVSCARCHDHKFDAISARDYYALYGVLESSSYRLVRFETLEADRRTPEKLAQFRARFRPVLQRALVEAMLPTLPHLSEYLLAARDALLEIRKAETEGRRPGDEWVRGLCHGLARARRLDAALLGRWLGAVRAAAKDAEDPLSLWWRLCDAGEENPSQPAAVLRAVQVQWREKDRLAASGSDGAPVVLDYAQAPASAWLPDGFAFGLGPVRPGDVCFGSDPVRPILQVFDRGAAAFDPAWRGLKAAPGAEIDPSVFGAAVRAGRTIRTPTFTLDRSGRLHYLVKGKGRAYVAAGHYVLFEGPLHRALLQDFDAGSAFRWVNSPDLREYAGLPVHVEFTPSDDSDFALAMVAQGDQHPSAERPNRLLVEALSGEGISSVEKVAAAYQQVFADVADRLRADRIIGTADAAASARLANWMVRRQTLFASDGPAMRRHVSRFAGPVLDAHAAIVREIKRPSQWAMAMLDGSGVDERVFLRGSPKTPGEIVPRRFLEALAGPEPLAVGRGSGRLELARQMTDPALNPLFARVMVNRVWQHLFGRGIVASADNFGVMGGPPTHPELLDYLADRFALGGWSVKRMVRELVLSNSYRMASVRSGPGDEADPQNLLLHRMRVRRLEAEAIRDAMLAVSGRLVGCLYGKPVPVFLTEFQEARGRPAASGPLDGAGRRSLYLAAPRNFLTPLLQTFDAPTPFTTVGRRTVSNVPAQALVLMNDPFVHQQARRWARRACAEPGTPRERVTRMFQTAFARRPTEAELAACLESVRPPCEPTHRARQEQPEWDEKAAWEALAHALFNVSEFVLLY